MSRATRSRYGTTAVSQLYCSRVTARHRSRIAAYASGGCSMTSCRARARSSGSPGIGDRPEPIRLDDLPHHLQVAPDDHWSPGGEALPELVRCRQPLVERVRGHRDDRDVGRCRPCPDVVGVDRWQDHVSPFEPRLASLRRERGRPLRVDRRAEHHQGGVAKPDHGLGGHLEPPLATQLAQEQDDPALRRKTRHFTDQVRARIGHGPTWLAVEQDGWSRPERPATVAMVGERVIDRHDRVRSPDPCRFLPRGTAPGAGPARSGSCSSRGWRRSRRR